ncbi:hypothetical protein HYPSUDRAFT_43203 [Hypholoma sublateritium FD-334 SS-4]|uniref:Major facilitator superfamily (MFS) profile domain-containing protein n=1 Tax=Hypholoma sublateritium (strain FD-334 SS-4) TaxID=945553 RepID=A0A0D2L1A9_HYPSF|nr:hypothetical protein HYPSUDRAFT_43203 [Hypholoma sublateritium FD-334 SS-4]
MGKESTDKKPHNTVVVSSSSPSQSSHTPAVPDIEHVHVHDDPREWSRGRKIFTLTIVSFASLILTISVAIYNPSINDIIADLDTTYQKVAWTLSSNALVTGATPLLWGAFTEMYGRKSIYLASITLFIVGSGVGGFAKTVTILIVMRVIQGMGASAVLTLGAATLADMYDAKERGSVMGVYYAAPLLGPSLGPIIGGILTQIFSWRATFYFLAIFGGVSLLAFIVFRDTFRRDRSLSYQAALRQAAQANCRSSEEYDATRDVEKREAGAEPEDRPPKIGLRHMQIIQPTVAIFRRPNNVLILCASGLIFGGISYCIPFTTVRTLGAAPYNYKSLDIGFVLLSLGIGSIIGSVLGGRWSDRVRQKHQQYNNGVSKCEHRLISAKIMLPVLPASLIVFAWTTDKKVNIAPICAALFTCGVSSAWMYSSMLAYIVDANSGRSSSAVAANSFLRGVAGFVAAEVAIPLQNALGDGGIYTLIAGIMVIVAGIILLVIAKGSAWRERAEEREIKSHTTT